MERAGYMYIYVYAIFSFLRFLQSWIFFPPFVFVFFFLLFTPIPCLARYTSLRLDFVGWPCNFQVDSSVRRTVDNLWASFSLLVVYAFYSETQQSPVVETPLVPLLPSHIPIILSQDHTYFIRSRWCKRLPTCLACDTSKENDWIKQKSKCIIGKSKT